MLKRLGILFTLLIAAACGQQNATTEGIHTAGSNSVYAVAADGSTRTRSVSVSGTAEVRVAPDEIALTVGVETWDQNLSLAKSKNDGIVQKALAELKSQGIEDKFIQTDYLNIEPRYRDYSEQREFLGYYVRKNIGVTLKDVDTFEDVLSALLEAGVNYVYGVEFRTTELRAHRDEARALALKAAREKAEAMAKELGQEIGAPLSIQEQQSMDYGMVSWWGSTPTQNVVQNVSGAASELGSTMALGQIPISATVTVEFELK